MKLDTLFDQHVQQVSRAVAEAYPPVFSELVEARHRRRRGWLVAAAAFLVTVLVVGMPSLLAALGWSPGFEQRLADRSFQVPGLTPPRPDTPILLGSGDEWAFFVWEEDGLVCRHWVANLRDFDRRSFERLEARGDDCGDPKDWPVRGILSVGYTEVSGPEGFGGESLLIGLLTPDAARVRATFSLAGPVEVEVIGRETGFPYLGFGKVFDPRLIGLPTGIEVYAADGTLLASYDTGACDEAAEVPGMKEVCP